MPKNQPSGILVAISHSCSIHIPVFAPIISVNEHTLHVPHKYNTPIEYSPMRYEYAPTKVTDRKPDASATR